VWVEGTFIMTHASSYYIQPRITVRSDATLGTVIVSKVYYSNIPYDGNTAALAINAESVDGLSAQYTVKMDAQGRVAGYGLASGPLSPDDPANFSEFTVIADRFSILAPADLTGTNKLAFTVDTETNAVYMDGAYVRNLRAETLLSGTITATLRMEAATVVGGSIYGTSVGAGGTEEGPTTILNSDGSLRIGDNAYIDKDGNGSFTNLTASGSIEAQYIAGQITSSSGSLVMAADNSSYLGYTYFGWAGSEIRTRLGQGIAFTSGANQGQTSYYMPGGVHAGGTCDWTFEQTNVCNIDYLSAAEAYCMVNANFAGCSFYTYKRDPDGQYGSTWTYIQCGWVIQYRLNPRLNTGSNAGTNIWSGWMTLKQGSYQHGYKTQDEARLLTLPAVTAQIRADWYSEVQFRVIAVGNWDYDGGFCYWKPNGGVTWTIA
jgi:hypothetical protein